MSDSSHPTIKRNQLFEALAVMAFAAGMYGVTFTFDKVPAFLAQGIQPTVFPRAILILMFALALIQAIKAARLTPKDLSAFKPNKPIQKVVYLTVLMLIALPVMMPIIGTFPAFAVFLPALSFLWGERRWKMMVLSFAGFTAFVYVLFRLVMNVPLP